MKTLPVLLISAVPAFAWFRRGRQLFIWLAVVFCVGGGFSVFGQGSLTPPGQGTAPQENCGGAFLSQRLQDFLLGLVSPEGVAGDSVAGGFPFRPAGSQKKLIPVCTPLP